MGIPVTFQKVAESLLSGTGGVVAITYIGFINGVKSVYVTINNAPEEVLYELGPFPLSVLPTVFHAMRDTMDLNKIRYIL